MRHTIARLAILLLGTSLAVSAPATAGAVLSDPSEPLAGVAVDDPRSDVVGDVARQGSIDVTRVIYSLLPRTEGDRRDMFQVQVIYRRALPIKAGRQVVKTKLHAEGRTYLLLFRAQGHRAGLDVFRITDEGRKEVFVRESGIASSYPDGDISAQVPTGIFKADELESGSTVMQLVTDQGTARDTTAATDLQLELTSR